MLQNKLNWGRYGQACQRARPGWVDTCSWYANLLLLSNDVDHIRRRLDLPWLHLISLLCSETRALLRGGLRLCARFLTSLNGHLLTLAFFIFETSFQLLVEIVLALLDNSDNRLIFLPIFTLFWDSRMSVSGSERDSPNLIGFDTE